MRPKKIIIFGITIFLIGCTSTSNISSLNCKQTFDAFTVVGTETSKKFNGKSVTETQNKALKFCESNQITDESKCTNSEDGKNCYFTIGIQTDKISNCKENNACKLAYATSHIANCGVYRNQIAGGYNLENICLMSKAFIQNDETVCKKIETESKETCEENPTACFFNQSECLWGISDRESDISICKDIPDYKYKRLCYFSYALKNKDLAACEKINKKETKQLCIDMVKDPKKIPEAGILSTFPQL